MLAKHKQALGWCVLGVIGLFALAVPHGICKDTYVRWGLEMPVCTDGIVRQTADLRASRLRRGSPGNLTFTATAHYTTAESDSVEQTPVRGEAAVALTLLTQRGGKQEARPLAVDWTQDPSGGRLDAPLTLPVDLPDGDYTLHAAYTTALGAGTVDLPLALYTPARIHVITDRPLYEPGNVVKFRAVVLRARDLAPLDDRPGAWVVTSPDGEVLLEEKTAATQWGVVAGSFPLDRGAASGTWHVAFKSGAASDEVGIAVKPFTLPRFRVEAHADKPFYSVGDTPRLAGSVVYASGAPVANAQLDVTWTASGDWPPPTDWLDTVLPKHATALPTGRFALDLPKIPADLVGKATLAAHLSAVDAAGDRVEGGAVVLLSEDAIAVSAVTELADGLIQSQNNRLYLRVTTPDGGVVHDQKIVVRRAWEPNDPGIESRLDEDGVAALQIDPGAPVNVVIPPAPYRPSKRPPLVARGEAQELVKADGAPLADQVEMDRWLAALAPCAKWFAGDASDVKIGLRVDRGGAIVAAVGTANPLGQCTANVLRGKRLPAGDERLYSVDFTYTDPPLATLAPTIEATHDKPAGVDELFDQLAHGARDCLPTGEDAAGRLPLVLAWKATAKSKLVELGPWLPDASVAGDRDAGGARASAAAMACAQARIAGRLELAEPAEADVLGLARFDVETPTVAGDERPLATTMLGYELTVATELGGKPATTKLRVAPGAQPDLRLRVSPVMAKPGDTVTAELLRGPTYQQKLPDKLRLTHLHADRPIEAALDPERHTATFAIDKSMAGWVEISGAGKRALVYVRPEGELAVAIAPGQRAYKPGELAELAIQTTIGGKGGAAAVGLIGVDASLGQLVALPGPDDMARVRPQVQTSGLAFDALDAQALALGRIRGANAAAATVLRVTAIPSPPELDAVIDAHAASRFDPVEELTDRFYVILAQLHVEARAWEASAPAGELMRPATMARLWSAALAKVAARGERVDDAYGRRLTLSRLPGDLLELTDPRMVIVQGTRLPEDVENWAQWVGKEKP